LGERADATRAAIGEPDRRQNAVDLRRPLRARDRGELAVERQHLARRQPRLITKELRQVADAAERRLRSERSTGKRAAATRRLRQAEKYFYGGRLSRAVRAEEAEDAVLHRQRKVVECDDLRVALGDVLEADRPVRDRHLPHGVRYRKCLALRERPDHLEQDRKSTRLNSSHEWNSYAV